MDCGFGIIERDFGGTERGLRIIRRDILEIEREW
jgi:hypothetical protein